MPRPKKDVAVETEPDDPVGVELPVVMPTPVHGAKLVTATVSISPMGEVELTMSGDWHFGMARKVQAAMFRQIRQANGQRWIEQQKASGAVESALVYDPVEANQ